MKYKGKQIKHKRYVELQQAKISHDNKIRKINPVLYHWLKNGGDFK